MTVIADVTVKCVVSTKGSLMWDFATCCCHMASNRHASCAENYGIMCDVVKLIEYWCRKTLDFHKTAMYHVIRLKPHGGPKMDTETQIRSVSVHMPVELRVDWKEYSRRNHRSMSKMILAIIERELEEDRKRRQEA